MVKELIVRKKSENTEKFPTRKSDFMKEEMKRTVNDK